MGREGFMQEMLRKRRLCWRVRSGGRDLGDAGGGLGCACAPVRARARGKPECRRPGYTHFSQQVT